MKFVLNFHFKFFEKFKNYIKEFLKITINTLYLKKNILNMDPLKFQ